MYNMSLSSPFILMHAIVHLLLHTHLSTFRNHLTKGFSLLGGWGGVPFHKSKICSSPHLEKSLPLVPPTKHLFPPQKVNSPRTK